MGSIGPTMGRNKSLNYAISCSQHQQFNGIAFLKKRRDFKSFWPTITIRTLVRDVEDRLLRFSPISSLVCGGPTLLCVVLLQRSSGAASVIIWGWDGRGGDGLDKLHVIGWEHSKMAVWAVAPPPALVYHLDPGDDVVGIE